MAMTMTRRQVFYIKKKNLPSRPKLVAKTDRKSSSDDWNLSSSFRAAALRRPPVVRLSKWKLAVGVVFAAVAMFAMVILARVSFGQPQPVQTYQEEIRNSLIWRGPALNGGGYSSGTQQVTVEEGFIAARRGRAVPSAATLHEAPLATPSAPSAPSAAPRQSEAYSGNCGVTVGTAGNLPEQMRDCLKLLSSSRG